MKRVLLIGSLAMFLFVPSFAPAAAQPIGAADDMMQVNKVLADLLAAYNKADVEAIASMMAKEVRGYGSVFDANGIDEFRAAAAAAVKGIRGAVVVGKPDVTMSGNLAYSAFMTDVQREGPGGMQQVRLRWTVIFQKASNRWAIVHFHVSPDPATR